jgi:hypothetical protein
MSQYPDRSQDYMMNTWGTSKLVTDSYSLPEEKQKLLREIDFEKNRKNLHKFKKQNELHERIRNDDDYDDWEYGTEPLFG